MQIFSPSHLHHEYRPTVSVDKADLYERLEREYTTAEFDELCFDFGIELDEDTTSEVEEAIKRGLPAERPQLKIEIPANRYDMLCIEGIARALRIFLGKEKAPEYKLVPPVAGVDNYLTVTIKPETAQIRPYFSCAILRNIKFTERSYASFIDLQDKLHQNIARKRQLVAIGTHDLDTLKPPFTYEALPPDQIKFVALGKTEEKRADELVEIYRGEKHISRYLHLIENSPVYPIIYDSNRTVLSMPPIINSEHSKITLNTRNVFIDLTATDETKLSIVTNEMVAMFSEYCEEPFTIEPVRLILPDGSTKITPDLSLRPMSTTAAYINSYTGLTLSSKELASMFERMGLQATAAFDPKADLSLLIPPTRPDILHPVDLVEDAAIAYGFNKLPKSFPAVSTVAQPLEVSKLGDLIRKECAMCGWVEVLPLILCSHDENFAWLNRKDDGKTAVKLANPKTLEYQVVRTSLLPGLLKTIRENRAHPLPIQIFETSDIALKDDTHERRARNVRRAGAVWCNKSAGFEVVHGLLGRIMSVLEVPRLELVGGKRVQVGKHVEGEGWWIEGSDDPTYFPGRAAKIFYRPRKGTETKEPTPLLEDPEVMDTASTHPPRSDGVIELGSLGILHPSVLEKFEIPYPCSALEFDLTPFVKEERPVWA
ncbi:phenylalanyl-tRNA synthetase, beta subunit [Rhizoctonia solani AG-3 Rhs1AP]|uniref:Phenylalanine--tRNA ligase beta subunit n=2 Tax=Rhizoctonia solani AG-3 TaxID=1086053 RepID=A0A074S777_9AGAM|nr:phenylalanyl-tRNA synthetase, beta subunit [Rhizoctonia solani AG-3 Rhs1AP]KEP53475.1 phenylalanyl-tRNA synthetase, beta subunit [Rhizoctonia solani 123E]